MPQCSQFLTDLIYKCGGIDKRTIEKFEKVSHDHPPCLVAASHCLSPLAW